MAKLPRKNRILDEPTQVRSNGNNTKCWIQNLLYLHLARYASSPSRQSVVTDATRMVQLWTHNIAATELAVVAGHQPPPFVLSSTIRCPVAVTPPFFFVHTVVNFLLIRVDRLQAPCDSFVLLAHLPPQLVVLLVPSPVRFLRTPLVAIRVFIRRAKTPKATPFRLSFMPHLSPRQRTPTRNGPRRQVR
ncbi:hypothetical protein QTP88_024168 [Uroleucon formosanum]